MPDYIFNKTNWFSEYYIKHYTPSPHKQKKKQRLNNQPYYKPSQH